MNRVLRRLPSAIVYPLGILAGLAYLVFTLLTLGWFVAMLPAQIGGLVLFFAYLFALWLVCWLAVQAWRLITWPIRRRR